MRELCQRQHIPLPPQGHWAKAPERRSSKPTPLPDPDNDRELDFVVPLHETPAGQSELEENFGAQIATEALPENRIIVGDIPNPPHLMTKAVIKGLEKARPDQHGAVTCALPAAFRVRVPKESVDRACRLIEALARALDARGPAFEKGPENGTASVRGAGQLLRLSLEETSSRQMHRATEVEKAEIRRRGYNPAPLYDFKPSGTLMLKIDNGGRAGLMARYVCARRRG